MTLTWGCLLFPMILNILAMFFLEQKHTHTDPIILSQIKVIKSKLNRLSGER